MSAKANTNRLQACNIFEFGADTSRIWSYTVSGGQPSLKESLAGSSETPPPVKCADKGWSALWLHKLNVAWFPEDQVFLRVAYIPDSTHDEMRAMIELQLERLSPLPVAQVVWGFEVVPSLSKLLNEPASLQTGDSSGPSASDAATSTEPQSPGDSPLSTATATAPAAPEQEEPSLLTVVVVIVARARVEEFLGKLEAHGFMADRLELPLLQRLLTAKDERDGVWLLPSVVAGQQFCLAGWWWGGVLRNLNLVRVSGADKWGETLAEQLTQIAWSGEVEGWLDGPLHCHLIADADAAREWTPILKTWSGGEVNVVSPPSSEALASIDVRNLASGGNPADFLPEEYAVKYRQRFVDRLWMGGLGAIVGIYLAFILVSFLRLQVTNFQQYRVNSSMAGLSGSYTNALQMRARIKILQEQVNLRFAALECWKAATTLLPADLTLTDLSLQQGKDFTIHGLAPPDQVGQIIEYNQALKNYRVGDANGPFLFSKVNPYNSYDRPVPGGQKMTAWDFKCEVQRTEVE